MSGGRSIGSWWSVLALAATAFFVAYSSPIDFTYSDPWGNLLTAQAILEHGTIKLDAYPEAHALSELRLDTELDGHRYYDYPVGTPVLAVPAVWLARLAGMDMADEDENTALQQLLAALTVVFSVPLIFVLCRLYLPYAYSLLITVVFVFGSSVASTLGTAFWSSNLTFLLNLTTVWILARDRLGVRPANPYLIGVLLFLAYLCRPTAALLVVVVIGYLALARRPLLWRTSGVVAVLGCAFVVFAYAEFGLLVPPYYAPSGLGSGDFWTALVGNVVSPSRGVLVLYPFLLPVVVGGAVFHRRLAPDPLLRLALIWLGLHWITVSSPVTLGNGHTVLWWGAWSFGNRLFADALPALILLTIGVFKAALDTLAPPSQRRATVAFVVLGGVAIFIHSYQGLYNVYPFLWSQDGTYVDHLFDWQHPQFLASAASLARHRRQHLLPAAAPRSLYDPITPTSEGVIFENWSLPEGNGQWRWSNGTSATILFRTGPETPATPGPLVLEVVAGTFQAQRLTVFINDVEVGTIDSRTHWEPATYRFNVAASALAGVTSDEDAATGVVEIRFSIPQARSPASLNPDGRGDRRLLGLCLRELILVTPT
ncbi:MAG: hypothetical protein IH849_00080 [Acidobacteria bacterium]|nr:hypothetical protein [Acidobacteriota bacterium]